MRPMILLLAALSGSACAARHSDAGTGRAAWTGTATFSCGVTDGAASRIELVSDAGGTASIFVHDLAPESLSGSVPIGIGSYSASSARLEYCERGGACVTASDGAITFAHNDRKAVSGGIRFSADGAAWREFRFALRIVAPSRPTICG